MQEDFLRPVVQQAMRSILEVEMEECLQAAPFERSDGRLGYRSGHYRRRLLTRVGTLELRAQDRAGRFSTQVFESYARGEKALVAALAQMYVQGVSTRKVAAIIEELCGHEFSASSISAITAQLDGQLRQFAERALAEAFPYRILDARSAAAGLCPAVEPCLPARRNGPDGSGGRVCPFVAKIPHSHPPLPILHCERCPTRWSSMKSF